MGFLRALSTLLAILNGLKELLKDSDGDGVPDILEKENKNQEVK